MAYNRADVNATTIETYYGPSPDTGALSNPDAVRRNAGVFDQLSDPLSVRYRRCRPTE